MIIQTVKEYIQSKDSLIAKITAIEALIDAMLLNTIDAIEDSGTASYTLDDGQMKVSTEFRSAKEIASGVLALEKLLNNYTNKYNGHITVLRGRLNY